MQQIIQGDCLEVLATMAENSVDAIVTDPPAGIAFMGKDWDKDKGSRDEWIAWMQGVAEECKRVLKPGGHALVWTIPRTSHWTAMAWENAGWEVRDKIAHAFANGFPKSHNISKAIDKHLNAEREVVGEYDTRGLHEPTKAGRKTNGVSQGVVGKNLGFNGQGKTQTITAPATPEAQQWDGWGTALKPAREDWLLLRKPFKGTVAANVLKHGTGGLNIDGCRVEVEERTKPHGVTSQGRWPANFIHDGSEKVVELFPQTDGRCPSGKKVYDGSRTKKVYTEGVPEKHTVYTSGLKVLFDKPGYADSGSAARFFYAAKASQQDRGADNIHPTVKPTALMRYLCRLVTPPGGTVLDPFMGSGSTGKACVLEGFGFIGIEQDADYVEIARARIKATGMPLFSMDGG